MNIRILSILMTLLISLSSYAVTIDNVEVAQTDTVKGAPLQLNGAGERSKFFMDVYVAALYLPKKNSDAHSIMMADEAQMITLTITSSMISHDMLVSSIKDGMKLSAGDDYDIYAPMMDEIFNTRALELKKGDVFRFIYEPGIGTHFYRNEDLLRTIDKEHFKAVLFGIWLGDDPIQKSLKKDLLGKQ